jgi:hypothetical protein
MSNTTLTSDSSIDLDAAIDGYLAAWNATDPSERAAIIERVWTPDARMSDPLVDVTGHAELADVFARFHETYPGCSFRRTGGPDGHHELVRWGWEMVDPDGTVVLDGIDVAVVANDGRLQRVAGFFGAGLPA